MSDIDFIIPWVDGSDPEWLSSYNRYAPAEKRISHADAEPRLGIAAVLVPRSGEIHAMGAQDTLRYLRTTAGLAEPECTETELRKA